MTKTNPEAIKFAKKHGISVFHDGSIWCLMQGGRPVAEKTTYAELMGHLETLYFRETDFQREVAQFKEEWK